MAQAHPSKKQTEYIGTVAQRCRAVASVTHGGQIICDTATLEGIRPHLTELYKGCIGADAKQALHRLAKYAAVLMPLHLCSRMACHFGAVCGPCQIAAGGALQP